MTSKTVFPDTNILLHYPPIDEIDWLKWCQCDSVKVIFCLQVIDELDEKKNHETLSQRASKAIKKIQDISANHKIIKANVVIDLHAKDLGVTKSSSDEIIVQQALDYKNTHPNEDVYLLSEDLGMMLRCGERVSLIEPDKNQRLESPNSELYKKTQKLKKENDFLKNQIPNLRIVISEDKEPVSEQRESFAAQLSTRPMLTEEVINQEIMQYEAPHLGVRAMLYSPNAIQRYKTAFTVWYHETNKAIEQNNRSFDFNIHVINSGTSPACNVSVSIKFPNLFQFLRCEEEQIGEILTFPSKPQLPQKDGLMVNFGDLRMPFPQVFSMPIKNQYGPWVDFKEEDSGFVLSLTLKKLRHFSHETFKCTAGLLSLDGLKPFNIEATLLADETPQKTVRKIPIFFEQNLISEGNDGK